MSSTERTQKSAVVLQAWVLVVGVVLMGIKLLAWRITGSTTILGDALESVVNIVAGGFALYSLILTAKPRDREHPYGHGKVEFISAGFEGGMVIMAGGLIIWRSIVALTTAQAPQQLELGIACCIFVARTDFNFTKDHALDIIYNDQPFRSNVDFLNSVDPAFPGIPNAGTQQSDRRSLSIGFRSNFGGNLVNQFRYAQLSGWIKGSSNFDLVGGPEYFQNLMMGYTVSLANAGLTNPTIRNASSSRSSPTMDFTDTLTWVKGDHTISVGGQFKRIETISDSLGLIAPTVSLGVVTGDPVLTAL